MDDSASKGGDNDADENSPPKKAKTDDQQQPSTSSSSSSGSTASSSNMASTSTASTECPNAEAGTSETRERESAASTDPPEELIDIVAAAAAAAREDVLFMSDESDDNIEEDVSFLAHVEQSVQRLVHRNVRNLSNLRARARNAAGDGEERNDEADGDAASGSDGEDRREHIRIRNQLADNIVELLAPGLFPGYDSSNDSDSSGDAVGLYMDDDDDNNARGDGAHNGDAGFAVIDHELSESSSSHSESASSLSSSPESSESSSHSSATEYEYLDLPLRSEQNVENLECLQTSSVKCKWNILREISQRQHGVAFHKTPATVGRYQPSQFQRHAYGSVHLVQRLGLLHKLAHHTGCVNSLNFHPSGKLLASGSDDLRINLWHWESKKLLKSIRSGHKNNVFQTKFMTCDGYENEIEIISTGRDGHVRHTTVRPSGHASTKVIFRSPHAIHKVAIPARNDLVFLMAGEDEKVRLCDMRQAKVQTVVDVGKRLYSIATHPYDSEFCVSGSGSAVRVYDLRRPQKPLRMLFVGEQAEGTRSHSSITCAVYNHEGNEILASYSDDDIYLFKLDPPEGILIPTNRFRGHCNVQTIKGVSFFGPHSEYVVSGSDCGYVYIWEKSSQRIVNWLKSNPGEVVNCLEPHPEFPILATSGVDYDIKVWVPKGLNDEQTAPVFEWQDLKRYVKRNVNRNPYRTDPLLRSAHLSRLFPALAYRRRSLAHLNVDDDLQDDDFDRPGRSRLDCSPS